MSQPLSLARFAEMTEAEKLSLVRSVVRPLAEQRVSPGGELSAPSAKAQTPKPKGRTVRPVRGSMNQSEGRYARHLERQVARGEIAAFWFEPLKFRLADKTYYSPDFMVMGNDGLLSLHELKGWMEDDAAVKLKVTAEAYWIFPIRLVKEKRGIFTVTEVGR